MARTKFLLLLLSLVNLTLGAACSPEPTAAPPPSSLQATTPPSLVRPNFILIIADDLDLRLGTLEFMPVLQEQLVRHGLSFEDFYVTNSLCCPSRATFLRGQYSHNHKIYNNAFPTGGFEKFMRAGLEASTLATWLQAAGYRTVLLGKYLNGYPLKGGDPQYIPPGWSEWYSPARGKPYSGFNYYLNENGQIVAYGEAADEYLTDVLASKTADFIRRVSAEAVPFFVYLSIYAPHEPAKPAYRHRQLFLEAHAPQTPSFNEADVSDKPAGIQGDPLLTDQDILEINELYINRLQSMQAVDEMIATLIETLEATGVLENTYIVFTSDNGFHLGQHRLKKGKGTAYSEDIQTPFIIRGPDIPAGESLAGYLTSNIDFAPTIAELAGIAPAEFVDGRSLAPLFSAERPSPEAWRQAILVEFYRSTKEPAEEGLLAERQYIAYTADDYSGVLEPPDGPPGQSPALEMRYSGLVTPRYKYVKHEDGFVELYDLLNDPYELENLTASADPALLEQLQAWLVALGACAGEICRQYDQSPSN